jgi:uncharacterized damage-inducible protein DinB
MATEHQNPQDYEHLIRLMRVARGLESGGFYNAAKLIWACLFSQEIRASNERGIPTVTDELDHEMQEAIDALATRDARPELIVALKHGQQAARENRTIPQRDIPAVHVCRTCGEVMLGMPMQCPMCGAHPLTLREFLPIYFLEPMEPEQAIAALAEGPGEVEVAIQGLSEEQMRQTPRPGEWAIRSVLAHILIAQGLLAARVPKILAEDSPSLQGVAAWAVTDQASLSAGELLKQYRSSREETVNRLKSISAQDWWRTAQHDEFGQVTLLQQASYFARHERTHLPQIQMIRQAIRA